jgi:DNA-binding LacI/PurR family transcriptional regulator
MVTIYDIARKTGFSVTTVSKVLNNYQDVSAKTKKIILEAVQETGYLPNSHARTLTTKKSWTLGVVFVESQGIGIKHPFFNAVIESFRQNVEIKGYDLLFASRNISNQKKSYLEHFMYRGVDGIVVICSNYQERQVQELIASPIPTVVIDLESDKTSVVYSDNTEGSKKAVEYLYSLGHRDIAHISSHPNNFAGEQRLRGYLQAMELLDLKAPESYIVSGEHFSNFSRESGYEAMKKLLSLKQRPTAIYAAGDNLAIGAIQAIKEAKLNVPDDFSIVGFDDIEISQYIEPPLTTIKQDTDLIGKNAAELVLRQIDKKQKIVKSVKVPIDLVIRGTCKKHP